MQVQTSGNCLNSFSADFLSPSEGGRSLHLPGEGFREEFQGNLAVQGRVIGKVDFPHPSLAGLGHEIFRQQAEYILLFLNKTVILLNDIVRSRCQLKQPTRSVVVYCQGLALDPRFEIGNRRKCNFCSIS